MTELATHYVEVTDKRSRSSRSRLCVLNEDLRFDTSALAASTSRPLDDLDTDLLVVLASVAYTDRLISRRRGTRWARNLVLSIPVYHPERWEPISNEISALLRMLSGDVWTIVFGRRTKPNEMIQGFLPGLSSDFRGATIIPYSGGLDSFAVLARLRHAHPTERALLVNARRGIRNDSLARPDSQAVLGIPYAFKALKHAEESYRTRTFVYFALAALAWRQNDGKRIWIGESGTGCLGPALVPFGIEQPVRGSHPSFTEALSSVLKKLWGVAPRFEFPSLWHTKGAVLAELNALQLLDGWQATRSCSRGVRRQHPGAAGTHCGLCTGCLFRRVSVLAANLGADQPETYFEDVMESARFSERLSKRDREVGVCAVLAMEELAHCGPRLHTQTAEIVSVASALGLSFPETKRLFTELLSRHQEEWLSFLDRLPRDSWIRGLCSLPSNEAA